MGRKQITAKLGVLDFFSQQQFFRFNKQSNTSNLPGIVCSSILWILILLFLALKLTEVSRGRVIYSAQWEVDSTDGSALKVQVDGSSFMVALESSDFQTGQSVASGVSQFVAQIERDPVTNGSDIRQIQMEKCTANHFQSISNVEAKTNMLNWNCLPLGSVISLEKQGSSLSPSTLKMVLSCPACATTIKTTIHILTPLVSPASQDKVLTYAIDSRNYVLLENNVNSYLSLTVQAYSLQTDSSSMPWSGQTSKGAAVAQLGEKEKIVSSSTSSAEIIIMKSGYETVYSRRTDSVLSVLAFAGGLFLFCILLLGVLKWFSQSFFDMAVAADIYHDRESKDYHLGYYLAQRVLSLGKWIGLVEKWETPEHFNNVEEKVSSLRDIAYQESRINFLEMALSLLLEKHQLKVLHLANRQNLGSAFKKFETHRLKKDVLRYFRSKNEDSQEAKRKAEAFFTPNCRFNPNSSGKSVQNDGKRNSSGSSQKPMKIELPLGTEMHMQEEIAEAMSARYRKNIEDYLDGQQSTSEDEEESISREELEDIVRRTKLQVQLLRSQAERSEGDGVSRRIYDKLVESDRKLMELLFDMPGEGEGGYVRQLNQNMDQLNPQRRDNNLTLKAGFD